LGGETRKGCGNFTRQALLSWLVHAIHQALRGAKIAIFVGRAADLVVLERIDEFLRRGFVTLKELHECHELVTGVARQKVFDLAGIRFCLQGVDAQNVLDESNEDLAILEHLFRGTFPLIGEPEEAIFVLDDEPLLFQVLHLCRDRAFCHLELFCDVRDACITPLTLQLEKGGQIVSHAVGDFLGCEALPDFVLALAKLRNVLNVL